MSTTLGPSRRLLVVVAALCCGLGLSSPPAGASRPNILIVTVDDMSADSVGAFGCQLADTTPTMDRLARQSLRFAHAHVQVGNCMPGRNLMFSGLFSHVNGVEGFRQNKNPDYPVLCDLAKQAGYFTAIRGKVAHSTPYQPYAWDAVLDRAADGTKHHAKNPATYRESTQQAIALAEQAGKPFCLLMNIADPHKPFYGFPKTDPYTPSKIFRAEEVPVPGFLPEDDVVRKELASYYSTVRRADDCLHEVLSALDASGKADTTFVMFFSDHGMPLPFAKTQLYHHSTHTPLIIRWPGVTAPGTLDATHMVSAIDFLPTLLEVMQHPHPDPQRLHGKSFAPLLRGQSQDDRDFVILQYNENSARGRHPMRGIQTREYLYLFNPWSNGKRKFTTATTGTKTYKQMVKRAKAEPEIAARLAMFDYRVVEELYDIRTDPDCLVNLVDDVTRQPELARLRDRLATALEAMADPVAPLLLAREDVSLREAYMAEQDAWSRKARAERRKKRRAAPPSRPRRLNRQLRLPATARAAGTPAGIAADWPTDRR